MARILLLARPKVGPTLGLQRARWRVRRARCWRGRWGARRVADAAGVAGKAGAVAGAVAGVAGMAGVGGGDRRGGRGGRPRRRRAAVATLRATRLSEELFAAVAMQVVKKDLMSMNRACKVTELKVSRSWRRAARDRDGQQGVASAPAARCNCARCTLAGDCRGGGRPRVDQPLL